MNARHAFIRDELSKGRYDFSVAEGVLCLAEEVLHRRLVLGLPSSAVIEPQQNAPGPERC